MVMTVAGRTCGASNKQQSDVYEENREETEYTLEEMKKHNDCYYRTRVPEHC
jgi:hypothetical protein